MLDVRSEASPPARWPAEAPGEPAAPRSRVAPIVYVPLVLCVLALAGTQVAVAAQAGDMPLVAYLWAPACSLYAVAALVALARRPTSRLGGLLALTGVVAIVSEFVVTGPPGMVVPAYLVFVAPLSLAFHCLMAFPTGRLPDQASRVVVGVDYFNALVLCSYVYLLAPSPLSIADAPGLYDAFDWLTSIVLALTTLSGAVLLARRLRRAAAPQRRALVPLYGWGIVALLSFPVATLLRQTVGLPATLGDLVQLTGLAGIPVALALTLRRGAFARTAGTEELTLSLAEARTPSEEVLRRVLGDPTARLLPARPATPAAGRSYLPLVVGERELGTIEHAPEAVDDAATVRAAGALVAAALEQARLTEALRDAGHAMVVAADRTRSRIAQDLHDGLQARLVLLAMRTDDPALRGELVAAADELRAYVQGVMPAGLVERGLEAALEDLIDRASSHVDVAVELGTVPLSPVAESTAYFVAAEALANAAKHASADRVGVRVAREAGVLRIEVHDDGVGGAEPQEGLGLRGIRDRVRALGGHLHIDSPRGRGTRLTVELPCAS